MRWSALGATGARQNASSPGVGTDEEDRGSISLLSLGMMLVAAMLIVVGVDITAVQLARTQLWDAADSAALDAADRIDEDRVYTQGLPSMVPVTSAGVAESPPIRVDVLNGLGAGDAFGGALCHALLSGWDPCVRFFGGSQWVGWRAL